MLNRCVLIVASIGALALAGCNSGAKSQKPTPAAAGAARFEETRCVTALPDGQPADQVRCGFVVVPETRSTAGDRTIRLAVMVLKATDPDPAPDPIVYVSGGPGISALQNDLTFFDNWLDLPLQGKRDIVIFDQRGTGFSEPTLTCPDERTAYTARLGELLTVDEEYAKAEAIALACGERLRRDGVNLSAYHSAESGADIRDIATALG